MSRPGEASHLQRRRNPASVALLEENEDMGQPVVHFEVIGTDPPALRRFYGALFEWEFDTSGPVAGVVSEAGSYGFVDRYTTDDGTGIRGGVGGGQGYASRATFYVGVASVEAALRDAERLGGTRVLGPESNPGNDLVIGHFRDPEGNVIGVAGGA